MNIISSLVSLAAIGLYCADIAHHIHNYNPPCYDLCGIYHDEVFVSITFGEVSLYIIPLPTPCNPHGGGRALYNICTTFFFLCKGPKQVED